MNEVQSTYPPPQHLLRDLRIIVDRDAQGVKASLEIMPEMLDGAGRIRVGVLATLVDVAAGETAIRAVVPQWIATSDLSLYVTPLPASGTIEARPRVIRKGRQTVVLEAVFLDAESRRELGLATLGFAILPARNAIQKSGHWADAIEHRTEFGHEDSGLDGPLIDTVGIEFDAGRPGIAHLAVRSYLLNSLGAIQGGAMAILLESTAEHFATATLAQPVCVRGLAIHYLKLARVGPVRAQTRTIARTTAGLIVHVEIFDEGIGDELLTVATVQLEATARA